MLFQIRKYSQVYAQHLLETDNRTYTCLCLRFSVNEEKTEKGKKIKGMKVNKSRQII